MKKHTKILGSVGVAAAISMGIFAVASPAMAEDLVPLDHNNNNTSADVKVKLKVAGETPAIDITSPLDGAIIIGKTFSAGIKYENANQLRYELIFVDTDGTRTVYDLPSKIVAETGVASGTDSFSVNVDSYGGKYGNYILRSTADGAGSTTDSVSFQLISFDFDEKGIEENTNNPIIRFAKAPSIYKSKIQAYTPEGEPIFETPLELILNPDGDTDLTLPFAKYGLAKGRYKVVATPYDEYDNVLDVDKVHYINYAPAEAPEVPDTGSILGDLGLSRQDLISTGVALLFVCAFFGILIIAKKNRSQKQRRR